MGGCRAPLDEHEDHKAAALALAEGQPTLALVDTILLTTHNTSPLGELGVSLAVDDSGHVYVTDRAQDVVIAFARDGTERHRFGRRGSGPAELSGVSTIHVADSMLFVESYRARRITVFHRVTGAVLGSVRYRGDVSAIALVGDTLYLAINSPADTSSLATVPLGALGDAVTPVATPAPVPLPREYEHYRELAAFGSAALAVWGDTLAMAFFGVNDVRLIGPAWRTIGMLTVPTRMRAGADPDSLARYFTTPATRLDEQLRAASDARLIARLPSGRLLLVHSDGRLEDPDNGRSAIVETGYVSVLDLERRSACVDRRLDIPGNEIVRVAARGDTLLVVDQISGPDGHGSDVAIVLRRYLIDDSGCWLSRR